MPTAILTPVARDHSLILLDGDALDRGVVVAFSDRTGGVSSTPYDSLNLAASVGDQRGDVMRNRAIVARAAGFDVRSLALGRQVHGNDLMEVERGRSGIVGVADGLVAREPGPVLGILTADCAPVLVEGQTGVAVLHAGWRGLVAGIVDRGVDAVGGVAAAWVGPSIRSCCYEVGPEVIRAFERRGLPVADDNHVDPAQAALHALERAGATSVAVAEPCTYCDQRYFSYRRDGVTGRQGAFISIATSGTR